MSTLIRGFMPFVVVIVCMGCADEIVSFGEDGVKTATYRDVYTYSNGRVVKVVVDPGYRPLRRSFRTMEEYHAFLGDRDKEGMVRVNDVLWDRLKHANDPVEISVLDETGAVEIGNYLYEVGAEAIYRRDLRDISGKVELEIFYGNSGEEDLVEFVQVALMFNGGKTVNEQDLRNPFAKDLLQLATKEIGSVRVGHGSGKNTLLSCNYLGSSNNIDRAECFTDPVSVPYSMDGYLPSNYQTDPGMYDTRIFMLNQSYRAGLKKKAYGVTQATVRRADSGDPYFGLQSGAFCPGTWVPSPLGPSSYNYLFSVRVQVEAATSDWAPCLVSKTTDRSGGAQSYHDAVAPPQVGFFGPVTLLSQYYLQ